MSTVSTRHIKLGDRTVSYDFSYKAVKNINLRIRADGSITVSAPNGCPMEKVRDFLKSRADFILRALGKTEARRREERQPPSPKSPTEGAPVMFLGKTYLLHISVGTRRGMQIEGERLVLYRREGDGDAAAKKIFREFCTEHLMKEVERAVSLYAPTFVGTGAAKLKTLSYRVMRSVWGTCRKSAGLITLNLLLIHAPREAIEYVVLHEMTHLLHSGHQKNFWAEVAKRMPDHKQKRALLRAIDTRAEGLL